MIYLYVCSMALIRCGVLPLKKYITLKCNYNVGKTIICFS